MIQAKNIKTLCLYTAGVIVMISKKEYKSPEIEVTKFDVCRVMLEGPTGNGDIETVEASTESDTTIDDLALFD